MRGFLRTPAFPAFPQFEKVPEREVRLQCAAYSDASDQAGHFTGSVSP